MGHDEPTHSAEFEVRSAYDEIFAEEGRGLPVAFLRALAIRESQLNPNDRQGPAWGLMQVGIDRRAGNVLAEYNRRHGTHLTKQDMLTPRYNVRVASDLLRRIVDLYERGGIRPDWDNGNYVQLVVAGWNSGYSRKAGVMKVVDYLRRHDLPVTAARVYSAAKAAGATRHLQSAKKQRWQRSVVERYWKERGVRSGGSTWVPIVLVALLLLR